MFRRIVRAGGTRIALKTAKAMPLVGAAFVVALAGYEIRRKGLVKGIANIALDATPVLGTAKNIIEVFTGDWLPDKSGENTE